MYTEHGQGSPVMYDTLQALDFTQHHVIRRVVPQHRALMMV